MLTALRTFAAVALVALSVIPGRPASGFHEEWDLMPLVWEATVDSATWVALRFTVDEDPRTDDVGLAVLLDDVVAEGWLLDSGYVLDETNGGWFGWFGGSGCGSLLDGSAYLMLGDQTLVDESRRQSCLGESAYGLGLGPGTYTFVQIVGSDGDFSARMSIHAASNVEVHGLTSGGAFSAADDDFGGVVNGHARTLPIEAQVILDGAVNQSVETSLYGGFWNRGTGRSRTEGPEGWQDEWPHGFYLGEPAGDYTFRIDSKAYAEVIFGTSVWLLVADVTLPG